MHKEIQSGNKDLELIRWQADWFGSRPMCLLTRIWQIEK